MERKRGKMKGRKKEINGREQKERKKKEKRRKKKREGKGRIFGGSVFPVLVSRAADNAGGQASRGKRYLPLEL